MQLWVLHKNPFLNTLTQENTMFNTAIDTVQTGKKQIVSTFVKHETLADTINKFVDAETAYTKALFDNMTGFYSLLTNKDFAKEVAETFTPSFTTTKAASKKAK
jgi:hypothetical protein